MEVTCREQWAWQGVTSPSFHSRVAGLMKPKSSKVVTALGLRSTHNGFSFMFWYVLFSERRILLLPGGRRGEGEGGREKGET